MSLHKTLGIACVAALLAACASPRSQQSIYLDGDRLHSGTGATMSSPGSGYSAPAPAAAPEKEQRGNTPPGVSRDGAGPAEGAIVDPTGATKK